MQCLKRGLCSELEISPFISSVWNTLPPLQFQNSLGGGSQLLLNCSCCAASHWKSLVCLAVLLLSDIADKDHFPLQTKLFLTQRMSEQVNGHNVKSSSTRCLDYVKLTLSNDFDLGISWQVDLSGYILPPFLKVHLSCSPAAVVLILHGTKHCECLIR